MYACAIDASKAFDKINRMMLMYKLIGKVSERDKTGLESIVRVLFEISGVHFE